MSFTVVFFIASGLLIAAGMVLREVQVGDGGTEGRGPLAHRISIVLAILVILSAGLTLHRLIDMALS
ncbi:hypothetical protein GYA93_13150 [Gordonia desulfuricans]|uniref:Uncharacterized protein n=1 Tax=Gordonia desulfuricans TaxID=89051 RepID=A0A7K3LQM4_9ACTN|nr:MULTISPECIES: hypothetical protein [Gordonia]KOY49627.1 hypothetical protein ISGA_09020 [Gordonia sp. NB41Y]NDK90518.1 hypothetical protein [Gordonia desulfuricans]WLP90941.1 hypothetical protein Q9K23_01200 [Gordonia sp. NB41Y]